MTFPGVRKPEDRADLVAFLEAESAGRAPPVDMAQGGGMMGMGMGTAQEDLKRLGSEQRVTAVRLCHDTYNVATEDGATTQFWEPNLRFKTDSSGNGPPSGKPALVPDGMMGDRADVIFTTPEEMASFVKHEC
jgi:cytochrome c